MDSCLAPERDQATLRPKSPNRNPVYLQQRVIRWVQEPKEQMLEMNKTSLNCPGMDLA